MIFLHLVAKSGKVATRFPCVAHIFALCFVAGTAFFILKNLYIAFSISIYQFLIFPAVPAFFEMINQKNNTMHNEKQIYYASLNDGAVNAWIPGDSLNKHCQVGYNIIKMDHDNVCEAGLPFELCNVKHPIVAHFYVTGNADNGKIQKNVPVGQTILLSNCNGAAPQIYTRAGIVTNNIPSWDKWKCVTDGEAVNKEKWTKTSNIDTYTTAGIYNISGERTNTADGFPIDNAAPGHTFHARLQVLDSSISGTGESDDKCVTQVLTLSNRTGGDGGIYVRTGRAATKEQLAAGNGWEMWGKMQQSVQVGVVPSLDNFIDNGIYSGIYTNEGTHYETFVMVVINNYVAATATGKTRCISQFKYALNTDSNFGYKTRTGRGSTSIEWGTWVDLGAAKTSDIQDGAITAQKLAADVREKVDSPLRPLFIAAGAEYNDSGADTAKTAPWGETVTHKAGHYYLNGLGDITEEQMMDIYNAGMLKNNIAGFYANNNRIRTILPAKTSGQEGFGTISLNGILNNATSVESVLFTDRESLAERLGVSFTAGTAYSAFSGCSNLVYIQKMNFSSVATLTSVFDKCNSLVYANINGLKCNLNWGYSVMISKESVIYTIQNAFPVSAITITLHPDAYARLADDADVVAALEAQPLVSLVSA